MKKKFSIFNSQFSFNELISNVSNIDSLKIDWKLQNWKLKILAIISIASILLGIYYYAHAIPRFPVFRTHVEKVEYLSDVIAKKGAEQAYESMAKALPNDINVQHAWAHAFGEALFRIEGVEGISVCDSRFSFGCFHQFFSDAIQALGMESIPELDRACFEKLASNPLACQHGIGHGILANLGYDKPALIEALDECGALPVSDPIGGCYGGVFMEYNVRTMLAEDAQPREYTGNPFAPCDALGAHAKACIYWQPQWWTQGPLFDESRETQFRTMGDYCRDFAETEEFSRACFEGIGNIVSSQSDFDPAEARELCLLAGVTDRERLFCLSIGANHFGVDVSIAAGESMCASLSESATAYCLAYARNHANTANVLPL